MLAQYRWGNTARGQRTRYSWFPSIPAATHRPRPCRYQPWPPGEFAIQRKKIREDPAFRPRCGKVRGVIFHEPASPQKCLGNRQVSKRLLQQMQTGDETQPAGLFGSDGGKANGFLRKRL